MNPNQNPNKNFKPINRVATPIKLDESGQRIDSVDNPVILTEEMKSEIIEERKIEEQNKKIEAKNKKIEEHDPSTAIFVVVLLIILAVLVAFIFLYIIPVYQEGQKNKYEYNDRTEVITTEKITYKITPYTLDSTVYIDKNFASNVEGFSISFLSNGFTYDLRVNDKLITKTDILLPKAAMVDDLLLLTVQDKRSRTTRLYAIDNAGNVVKEFYNLGDDGMVLLPDSSSVIFNNVNFVLLGSRVIGSKLILSNDFGVTDGVNICSKDALDSVNVDETFRVLSTYTVEYLGNHNFSEPRFINGTSLADYKTVNNLCR